MSNVEKRVAKLEKELAKEIERNKIIVAAEQGLMDRIMYNATNYEAVTGEHWIAVADLAKMFKEEMTKVVV